MKTKNILLLIFSLLSIATFSQDSKENKQDQIKALKVGYITSELSLTTEEATKFWPIYNTFDDKQYDLKSKKMKAIKVKMSDESLEKMSEKEASELLAQIESNDAELYQLRKKLVKDLRNVIPALKIIKLKKAEDNFKKKLLQQYRNKG